ncbi:MAG: hypothetical protein FJ014_14525 [Chloroflexi bacterium]|nr:hypothetical protein [Chloroflexota bacterium]
MRSMDLETCGQRDKPNTTGTHIWVTDRAILDRVSRLGAPLDLPIGDIEGILIRINTDLAFPTPAASDVLGGVRTEVSLGSSSTEETTIAVHVLGPLTMEVNGRPVLPEQWRQSGAGAENIRKLFAFLVHHRNKWLTGETICDAVWPREGDDDRLRTRFFRTMTGLRQVFRNSGLAKPVVLVQNGLYRLNPAVQWEIDADALIRLFEEGQVRERKEGLPAAVPHYQQFLEHSAGEYMADIPYEDVSYDVAAHANWWQDRREELLRQRREARRKLATHFLHSGRPLEVIGLWREEMQERERDPDALQAMAILAMQAYQACDREAEGLTMLKRLRGVLEAEGEEPLPELDDAAKSLRRGWRARAKSLRNAAEPGAKTLVI